MAGGRPLARGNTGLQGAITPTSGLPERAAREIALVLADEGVRDLRVGGRRHRDPGAIPVLEQLQAAGLTITDGQQAMLTARQIKCADEIMLMNQATAMVDAIYQEIFERLKPGLRESDVVALASKRLYELGSEHVEAVNAIGGERCSHTPASSPTG